MAQKHRLNFCLSIKNRNLLKQAAKQNRITMAQLLNALIEQKLADPIKILKEERKELVLKINKINDEIDRLEELKDERQN